MHDGRAAELLYSPESRRSVVQSARQDDANDARSVGLRRRTKERVNRRAKAILLRPFGDANNSRLDQQVMIGRRDVDAPRLDLLFVCGVCRGQRSGAREYLIEYARRLRRGVQNNEDRSCEVFR